MGAARVTLHWWATEIERLFLSQARHPITQELATLKAQDFTTEAQLLNCIATIAGTLDYATRPDYDAWLGQHATGGGYLWQAAGMACDHHAPKTLDALVRAGCCYSAFEQLHHIRRLARLGLDILPGELLNQHHIDSEMIINQQGHPAVVACFTDLFNRLQNDLHHCLTDLRKDKAGSPLFAVILLHIMRVLCVKYRTRDYHIAHAPASLTPLRKLWIAWRAKRTLA